MTIHAIFNQCSNYYNLLAKIRAVKCFAYLLIALPICYGFYKGLEKLIHRICFKKVLNDVDKKIDKVGQKHIGTSQASSALSEAQKQILPKANHLIDNVYVGALPASKLPEETVRMQSVLVNELKITHFVCLMEENELKRFMPYKNLISGSQINYLQFDIPDNGVVEDANRVNQFVDQLALLAKNPVNRLYIHCWGGNGRTSTISTILLSKLYGWTWDQALRHFTERYQSRKEPRCRVLPQSAVQFEQIKELCGGPDLSFDQWMRL